MVKKYLRIKKRRRQKFKTLLIKQILFSFEMEKYASFAEMNMMIMTITKAQLMSFDNWNMRYPSSKFYWLLRTLIYWKIFLLYLILHFFSL